MIITLKWLKDFVDLEGLSAQQIADAFTFCGFEMETFKDLSEKLQHVVVGQIQKIEKHPNADKLVVCQIFDGQTTHQIITHATNMKEGDFVPVALDGADLANGVKIKPTNMRGVDSCGMMCAGEELGIDNSVYPGAETDGIMIFDLKDCHIGQSVAEVFGMDDVVFDVNVLANRPDCQSVWGLAKELACALKKPCKNLNLDFVCQNDNSLPLNIEVQTENCPYYSVQAIKNIKLQPSPKWMQDRLRSVGIRAINNVVDITNYVLWEVGQPLHAFDYEKIDGQTIVVRQAYEKEKIVLLHDEEFELNGKNMVIANKNRPMALAGVMGGKDCSINPNTTNIVLESATFKKENIRKTSRNFGIRTDSSGRYERGVEEVNCDLGLKRALNLICELGVGQIVCQKHENKKPNLEDRTLDVDYSRVLSWLGVDIPIEDAIDILGKLNIKATNHNNILTCKIPPIRSDIENFSDIAEEIIRFWGFDTMPLKVCENTKAISGGYEKSVAYNMFVRNAMIGTGAFEVNTYSFISPEELNNLLLTEDSNLFTKQIKIKNPLGVEMSVMRTQMLSSMLKVLSYNEAHKNVDFSLFEIGKIFFNIDENTIPQEREVLAFVTNCKNADFFYVKSIVMMLSEKLGLSFGFEVDKNKVNPISSAFHPNISGNITWANKTVGVIGKIHPQVCKNFDVSQDVYYFELDLSNFPNKKVKKVTQPAKYPSSTRDLAFIVNQDVSVGDIMAEAKKSAGNLCENIEFFDVYQGSQVENGKKSVALRLVFRKKDGTLTQEEVNVQVEKVLKYMQEKLDAKLREQ